LFGYFKFNERYSTYEMQNVYKNYYCGTCFALQYHYGQLSRLLLSYDVTIFAIIMKLHKRPMCDRLKCYGQAKCKKELFLEESWKKIAALNILLAAEKLRDDIEDNKSLKAFLAQLLYGRVFKKARNDFPDIAETIKQGYKKILLFEKENKGILELAECFGEMMLDTANTAFAIDETQQSFIYEISRWLYVVDALDDYNKDARDGDFNPVVQEGVPFKTYIDENYLKMQELISDLNKNYIEFEKKYSDGCVEEQILCSIIKDTIPINTSMIFNEVQAKMRLKKLGSVWRKII